MKTITVPQPVELELAGKDGYGAPVFEKRTIAFDEFVYNNVLNQIAFGADLASLELRAEVVAALDNPTTITISDNAWLMLNNVLNHRKQYCGEGWIPDVGHQIISFMRAVRDAS